MPKLLTRIVAVLLVASIASQSVYGVSGLGFRVSGSTRNTKHGTRNAVVAFCFGSQALEEPALPFKNTPSAPRAEAVDRVLGDTGLGVDALEKPRILYAEDRDRFRSWMKEFLEERGYEVIAAANGTHVWRLFQQGQFAAVVTDGGMPGMTGMTGETLINEIKAVNPNVPVVLFSGDRDMSDRIHQTFPDVHIANKPYDPGVLADDIRRLIAAGVQKPASTEPLGAQAPVDPIKSGIVGGLPDKREEKRFQDVVGLLERSGIQGDKGREIARELMSQPSEARAILDRAGINVATREKILVGLMSIPPFPNRIPFSASELELLNSLKSVEQFLLLGLREPTPGLVLRARKDKDFVSPEDLSNRIVEGVREKRRLDPAHKDPQELSNQNMRVAGIRRAFIASGRITLVQEANVLPRASAPAAPLPDTSHGGGIIGTGADAPRAPASRASRSPNRRDETQGGHITGRTLSIGAISAIPSVVLAVLLALIFHWPMKWSIGIGAALGFFYGIAEPELNWEMFRESTEVFLPIVRDIRSEWRSRRQLTENENDPAAPKRFNPAAHQAFINRVVESGTKHLVLGLMGLFGGFLILELAKHIPKLQQGWSGVVLGLAGPALGAVGLASLLSSMFTERMAKKDLQVLTFRIGGVHLDLEAVTVGGHTVWRWLNHYGEQVVFDPANPASRSFDELRRLVRSLSHRQKQALMRVGREQRLYRQRETSEFNAKHKALQQLKWWFFVPTDKDLLEIIAGSSNGGTTPRSVAPPAAPPETSVPSRASQVPSLNPRLETRDTGPETRDMGPETGTPPVGECNTASRRAA